MILRARTRFNVTNWAVVTCDRLSTWFSSFPRRQLPRKSLISHCTVHYNSFQIPVSLSSVTKKIIARNNRDEPVCGPKQVRISKESRWRNEEMSVDEMFVGRKKINDWCGTSYLLYTLIKSTAVSHVPCSPTLKCQDANACVNPSLNEYWVRQNYR